MTTPKDAPRELWIVIDIVGSGMCVLRNPEITLAGMREVYGDRVVRYILADEEGKE